MSALPTYYIHIIYIQKYRFIQDSFCVRFVVVLINLLFVLSLPVYPLSYCTLCYLYADVLKHQQSDPGMKPGVVLLVCCCLVPATRGLGPVAMLERGWAKIDIAGYIERFLNAVGEYYEVMRQDILFLNGLPEALTTVTRREEWRRSPGASRSMRAR